MEEYTLDALTTEETGQVCVRCPDGTKALVLTVEEAERLVEQINDGLQLLAVSYLKNFVRIGSTEE
jgi:hypothetical protein